MSGPRARSFHRTVNGVFFFFFASFLGKVATVVAVSGGGVFWPLLPHLPTELIIAAAGGPSTGRSFVRARSLLQARRKREGRVSKQGRVKKNKISNTNVAPQKEGAGGVGEDKERSKSRKKKKKRLLHRLSSLATGTHLPLCLPLSSAPFCSGLFGFYFFLVIFSSGRNVGAEIKRECACVRLSDKCGSRKKEDKMSEQKK